MPSYADRSASTCRRSKCPKPAKPVGRPFKRAGKFEHRQRRFQIEFSAQHKSGQRALGGVAIVFGFDQPVDRGQRILRIDPLPVRDIGGGGGARCGGFGAGDRGRAELGQRLEQVRRKLGRQQRGEECRLLEFVDRFLDPVHQLLDRRVGVEAGDLVARLDDDLVGLLLDAPRRARQGFAIERLARLPLGDEVRDPGGDIARQAGLADDNRQQRAVDALQMPHEVRLDAIPGQADRAAFQQGFGGNAQDRLEKIHRRVAPKRAVQPLAESDAGRRRVMHGRGDQFAAAQREEAAVAEAMARRPIEHAHRIALGDPGLQDLAGLVPVDQEDQRCADRFEEGVAGSCRCRSDSGR